LVGGRRRNVGKKRRGDFFPINQTRGKSEMSDELAGKVAIVTGGSSGIGRGTVERFVAEGARVVIADVDKERGEALAASLGRNVAFKRTDVSDSDQVRELVDFAIKTCGGLHVMVNNAGISGVRNARLLDEDFKDFQRVLGINLLGVMIGTREAARHMSKNGGGSIVNISSTGAMQPGPGLWAYGAAKAAVIHFTKCAAVDLGEYAIRVNCIAPGNIETPIMGAMMGANLSEQERAELMKSVRAFLISRQPLQRQGTPEDLADAVMYFARDRSSFVTGTVLTVDGGMVTGSPATASSFQNSANRPATK
jgi:NAD(P)-dependent dehydrogenase (short-subunit alcohol dehydrogenase family)